MNNKQIIILFATVSNLLSCINNKSGESEKNIDNNYSVSLVIDNNVKFKLDEVSNFSPFSLQYIDDGDEQYLLTDNPNTISIDVYSFSKKKLIHRIFVNDNSTLLTNNIHGFRAINKDSIFAYKNFNMSPILIVLNDWKVKTRKMYKVINPKTQTVFFNHGSMTPSPSLIIENKIYFTELPIADISALIGTGYSPEMIYDYQKDTTYSSGMTWPSSYDNDWKDLFLYLKTHDDQGKVVYSWQGSHDLMIKTQDSIYQVHAKADDFEKQIQYASGKTIDDNLIESNQYSLVLYDRYREVYYRYALHGIPARDNDNQSRSHHDQPFSIIILDKNFKKIGETYLQAGKYNGKDSFVGKEGLYISNHNLRNYEMLGENIMSFSCFKLMDL